MKQSRAAIGTAVTALASLAMLSVAPAAGAATVSEPLATGLQGALQLDVSDGQLLVAQNRSTNPEDENAPSIGSLGWVEDDGSVQTLWEKQGVEVAGMTWRNDKIAFLTTGGTHAKPTAWLMLRNGDGSVDKVANLAQFEEEANPDGHVTYNLRGVSDRCVAKSPEMVHPYQGIVESHPYAIANAPGGGWYVADAAGNSILKVGRNGSIRVVHVVRAVTIRVTEAMAEQFNLPSCVVAQKGKGAFEGVPTDVEVARSGKLLVSSLPGGPEIEALAAKGSVYRVDPATGEAKKVAGGLVGATNVAISDSGDVYVAELFAGRIAKLIGDGKTETVADELDAPAAIEWFEGRLYASVGLFGPTGYSDEGRIVTITPDGTSD